MSSHVILIADDDEADVFFLTKALKETLPGVLVQSVPDGRQAIAYLAGQGRYADRRCLPFPAHLFLDLKMPLVSGLEVLQWLRRQPPEVARLPVTVLSGSQLAFDVEQVRALGAEYAVKPIEYAALLAMVRGFAQRIVG